jgi:exosortase/archaeosortase family protein
MTYGLILAIALAIVTLIFVGFGVSGYVIRRLVGRKAERMHGFVRFLSRYVVVFGLLLGLEAFLLWVFPSFHLLLRDSVAALVSSILHLAGIEASVDGPLISVGDSSLVFDITVACLGGVLFWVYLGLVSAEPSVSNKQRMKGILIGLGILFVFNLFRIVFSVYLEGATGLRVHDYFYVLNMLVVLLVWAGWLKTLNFKDTSRPEKASL